MSLTELLKDNSKRRIALERSTRNVFNELKKVFTASHVLAHFDSDKKILVITNASEFVIADILLQSDERIADERRT